MKKIIIKLFMVLCVFSIIFSFVNIMRWYFENKENSDIKAELNHSIITDEEVNKIEVDFDELKKKNSDTVAFLKVNNTNINYVVVKGNDNSYYLKHNFNKEYNRSGWIFMDYRNKLDGSDKNIIIYGHNTRDGSMFGTLRKVVKKEWYMDTSNYIITLILDNNMTSYHVFSTYSIDVEDYYIKTEFKDDKDFNEFLLTLKKRSVYNYGVDVDDSDSILTLSTCTGNGTKRMVLHAKKLLVEE